MDCKNCHTDLVEEACFIFRSYQYSGFNSKTSEKPQVREFFDFSFDGYLKIYSSSLANKSG